MKMYLFCEVKDITLKELQNIMLDDILVENIFDDYDEEEFYEYNDVEEYIESVYDNDILFNIYVIEELKRILKNSEYKISNEEIITLEEEFENMITKLINKTFNFRFDTWE